MAIRLRVGKPAHGRAAVGASGEQRVWWGLTGRLRSGLRCFHLTLSLALPPAGQKQHRGGWGMRMTRWDHADLGLNPDLDSQATCRSASSPLSAGTSGDGGVEGRGARGTGHCLGRWCQQLHVRFRDDHISGLHRQYIQATLRP